tara:strand:+ start:3469 stop:3717 length:249 start_codon:yes stop_codon:yes gene_type:complete
MINESFDFEIDEDDLFQAARDAGFGDIALVYPEEFITSKFYRDDFKNFEEYKKAFVDYIYDEAHGEPDEDDDNSYDGSEHGW